jgi:hypothetical protein
MTHLSRSDLNQIIELITPFARTSNDRLALLNRAFGVDERAKTLIGNLNLENTTSNFVTLTVTYLVDYGDFERGQPALLALSDLPTALVVSNDAMALGMILSLQEAEIRVQEDITIIGYDDIPEVPIIRPQLFARTRQQSGMRWRNYCLSASRIHLCQVGESKCPTILLPEVRRDQDSEHHSLISAL